LPVGRSRLALWNIASRLGGLIVPVDWKRARDLLGNISQGSIKVKDRPGASPGMRFEELRVKRRIGDSDTRSRREKVVRGIGPLRCQHSDITVVRNDSPNKLPSQTFLGTAQLGVYCQSIDPTHARLSLVGVKPGQSSYRNVIFCHTADVGRQLSAASCKP
jgi:hypothetical protein